MVINHHRQWDFEFTEAALAEEIAQAEAAAIAAEQAGPCAESVNYNPERDLIEIYLTNGSIFAFPPHLAQGLAGATSEQLNDVWIDAAGLSVHWDSLDADFSVLGLVKGIFGSQSWMKQLEQEREKRIKITTE